MLTVIADTCGFHDTCAGACSCESNTVRFGHETRFMHSCRENFITELAKYGMSKSDLVSNVNFFMNVPIRPNGELTVDDGVSQPGGYVELRAEMDVLVLISNCPQVNNPCNGFTPTPVQIIISQN
jgi:urea carboxylase-associated protein 1